MRTPPLSVKPTVIPFASEATLAAAENMAFAHNAKPKQIIGAAVDFKRAAGTSFPDPTYRVAAWQQHHDRFHEVAIGDLSGQSQADAAILFSILHQDTLAYRPVIESIQALPEMTSESGAVVRLMVLHNAAVVYLHTPALGKWDNQPGDDQRHLDTHVKTFLRPDLSNHARLDAVSGIAAFVSDLMTWGVVDRHMNPDARRNGVPISVLQE